MNVNQAPELERGYAVDVDDNFHFMDEDERWRLGRFATYEEAVAAAKRLIEEFFDCDISEKTAEELFEGYMMMGDDPFIFPVGGAPEPPDRFSAWDYAKAYAERLVNSRAHQIDPRDHNQETAE